MNELELFANNMTKAMAHANLTASETAAKARIPSHEFEVYASGVCIPDAATLGKIADVLHVKVKDLAGDEPLEYTSFGQELRAMREGLGLKRTEVAELTGVPYKSICNYEMGLSKRLTKANVQKFAETFGGEFMTILKKYNVTCNSNIACPKTREAVIHPAKADETELARNFAEYVKFQRGNLTCRVYADHLGVSHSTLKRMESGDYVPTPKFAEKVGFVAEAPTVVVEEKPVVIAEKKPTVIVEAHHHEEKRSFEAAWFKYLSFIDDDHEYRKAVKALAAYVFDGVDLPEIPDAKEANLIFRMIKEG